MRQRDERRKSTISSVIAAMQQSETELDASGKRVSLDDDIPAIISKQAKQRQESITEFRRGGREDLVAEEEAELVVLQAYLPQQMTREEITIEALQVSEEVGASSPKDMGTVMRPLMARLRGRADGKVVNQVVRELLAG